MIVYDLLCHSSSHRFEGWFKSSDDFVTQQQRGLIACPHCGSSDIGKAVQAPRLTRKANQLPQAPTSRSAVHQAPVHGEAAAAAPSPQVVALMQAVAMAQAEALKTSRYVGDNFADDARAMHYGEKDAEVIHGRTSLAEARELHDEGIGVMPLLIPVAPPEQAN